MDDDAIELAKLTELIDAFKSARAHGDVTDLGEFLPQRESSLYLKLRRELVRLDLEFSSYLRSAWERTLGRSASRMIRRVSISRDAERPDGRSHAERL